MPLGAERHDDQKPNRCLPFLLCLSSLLLPSNHHLHPSSSLNYEPLHLLHLPFGRRSFSLSLSLSGFCPSLSQKRKLTLSSLPVHLTQGHARPLTSIACNLLSLRSGLHITLLINPFAQTLVEKVVKEHELNQEEAGRLKVVASLVDRIGFSLDNVWEDLDER